MGKARRRYMKINGIPVQRKDGKCDRNATIALFVKEEMEKLQKSVNDFALTYDQRMDGTGKWEPIFTAALKLFWADPRRKATGTAQFPRASIVQFVSGQLVNDGHFEITDFKKASEMFEMFLLDNCGDFESGAWMEHTGGRGPKAGLVREWKREAPEAEQPADEPAPPPPLDENENAENPPPAEGAENLPL